MRLSLLVTLFIYSLGLFSQDITISGKIIDNASSDPLEYATVSVLNENDSSLATGGITDGDGKFKVKTKPGNYFLRIQFVTYQTREIGGIDGSSNINLGEIKLSAGETELDEIVVQGERTQMELRLDKKVYNVGKDLSNLGGSASDLLGNLPSVSVDVDGNVELRGSSNVKVLIDGKPSGLVGLSSTDALRQLQGNLIETVEIITNPSARYDAEGMAGIINIILKKDSKKGVNGSFQVNTGWPHNHGASINMNLRRKWINFFVNYGIDYRRSPGAGETYRTFLNPADNNGIASSNQFLDRARGGLSNNVRFGADFFLSEKSSITTSFLYRYSDELNESDLSFEDYDTQEALVEYTLREDAETEGDENLEYAINYTRKFERKGHQLTADIQYQNNYELEESDITQSSGGTFETISEDFLQTVKNNEGEDRLMLQSDYIHPFSEKGKFELGYRSTIRNVKNDYQVRQTNESGEFVDQEQFSTDFNYNEQVHAGYAIVSNEYEKVSWQLGLRSEMTDISSELEGNDDLDWRYINFFPSAFLTYKLKLESQLQLSYSRRIDRPRFRELSPMTTFTDNRRFRVGNPELQPEFTDSYEFGLLQNLNNSSIYYGIYYRRTTDLIQRVTTQDEMDPRVTYRKPYNAGISNAVGVEVNASKDFGEWYRLSGNVNFYRVESEGTVGDTLELSAETVALSTRLSNNFKFSDLFTAQLNVWYHAPEQWPQGKRLSFASVDLGISRDIWNKNGTISLNVRDLFNTSKYRYTTELEDLIEKTTFQWRKGPTFNLSLIYRLNQNKERSDRGGDGREGDDFGDMNGGGFKPNP